MTYFMKKILKPVYNKTKGTIKKMGSRIEVYSRDLKNISQYGLSAPRFNERIWVDPRQIEFMIERDEVKRVSGYHRSQASGVVIDWDDVDNIKPITDEFRVQYCYGHWKDGKSWEELGVIDHMSKSKKYGSWPREKIKARFEMLDQAFQQTEKDGRLKTRQELDPDNFRESGGILVHIAENGQPIFGGNGFHRLAISKVLELERIPACIGLVDKHAIQYLDELRKPDH